MGKSDVQDANLHRIKVQDIDGFKIGNSQNEEAMTGVTVILCEDGATAGVDVRGGSPATRETDLLKSENTVEKIHAVFLSGGSAYGLDCASGIMEYLEKKEKGFNVGIGVVPIVSGACIFDLAIGNSNIRPDKEMAMTACVSSEKDMLISGNMGGGTGATCGKIAGIQSMMKSGLGTSAYKLGNIEVGAIVVANPLGDIFDMDNNKIAGLLDNNQKEYVSSEDYFIGLINIENTRASVENKKFTNTSQSTYPELNTTIGCIITNAKLTKAQCNKLSSITHDAFARRIKPCHTSMDGDTIFTMTTSRHAANFDSIAVLATRAMEEAIVDAALSSNKQ